MGGTRNAEQSGEIDKSHKNVTTKVKTNVKTKAKTKVKTRVKTRVKTLPYLVEDGVVETRVARGHGALDHDTILGLPNLKYVPGVCCCCTVARMAKRGGKGYVRAFRKRSPSCGFVFFTPSTEMYGNMYVWSSHIAEHGSTG